MYICLYVYIYNLNSRKMIVEHGPVKRLTIPLVSQIDVYLCPPQQEQPD